MENIEKKSSKRQEEKVSFFLFESLQKYHRHYFIQRVNDSLSSLCNVGAEGPWITKIKTLLVKLLTLL